MKLIRTEDAVGHVLCHDMTQIVVGDEGQRYKGPRFRKGYTVRAEDVPVLLSMGKEHLYVWELAEGMLHENDAAERLARLCDGPGTRRSGGPSEGKIGIEAACDGVLLVASERLRAVNAVEEVMVATRLGGFVVHAGEAVAGTRVIPLVVREETVAAAERAAGGEPLVQVRPFALKRAAIIATGSEVAKGLIEDRFTPVIERKLEAFGMKVVYRAKPGDVVAQVSEAICDACAAGVDLVVCTGGMSVDPDDNTPGAIARAGARIVSYGAPVLPGAMLLVGYFDGMVGQSGPTEAGGIPVVGLPGCAMYNAATVFDLVLPRLVAGVPLVREDLTGMGEGGLCLGCKSCTFPHCPFGR